MFKRILLSIALIIAPMQIRSSQTPMQIRSFMEQPSEGSMAKELTNLRRSMAKELTNLRIDLNPDQSRSEEGFNDISNFLFVSGLVIAGSIAITSKVGDAAVEFERYGRITAESIPRKASSALAASLIIGKAVILKNLINSANSENLPIRAAKGFSVVLLGAFSWGLLTPRPRPQARTEADETTAELGARTERMMFQEAQNQNQENVAPVIQPQEQPHRASPPQSDAPEGVPE